MGGKTLYDVKVDKTYSLSFGLTTVILKDEYLRWLTARGANVGDNRSTNSKNRPVLLWPDGKNITMKEAEDLLEAKAIQLHVSKVYINIKRLEDKLQSAIDDLRLGYRLHRHVAKGRQTGNGEDRLVKLFVTVLPVTKPLDEQKNLIEINGELLLVNI